MSASTPNAFLNIDDAHLRVTSGNVYAQGLNISGVSFSGVSGLHTVTNTGNVTTNTLEFKNGAKAFVATSNVEVKGSLDVANVATIYNGSNADYDQKQKFTSTVSSSGNYFANTLAMSTNGLYAIVGAHGENKTYTFTRSGSTWTQEHTFSSTGYAVDISSHGTYAVVGANGSASVFYRSSGSTWDSGTTLTAAGISVTTGYGASVSISDDGSYAIVGATGQSAAWIFRRTGTTTWDAGVKIALTGFSLGFSVAISGDGLYALLGAHAQHTAYVFKRTGAYLWSQQAKITESDSFGYSVALSTDGSRALIGATGGNGKAYSYERAGSGWSQNAIITASDAASGDAFGSAVSLSSDGSYGIVGAPGSEKAYTFKNAGSVWTELGIETASDTASGHVFGRSVSISGDGIYALIGASGNEAAYSYERKETLVLDVRGEANVRTLNVSDDLIVTNNILVSNNLTVAGNLNVTTIRSDSNVVTEYTGPHDRPLRKYPEVALTSASQGGYVVDKSEESSSGDAYAAYRAFDGVIPDGTTTIGWRTDSGYIQNTGLADLGVTRFTGDSGEWVELQLPNSIKLSRIVLKVGNDGDNLALAQRRFPKVFVIYGYNGTSWGKIQEYTTSAIQSLTDVQTFHISNPTTYHNKFVLIVKQTYSVAGATSGVTNIGEIEYYGHEEGSGSLDTTLKTVYNVPATTGTQLEVYYDAKETSNYTLSGSDVTNVSDLSPQSRDSTATNVTIDSTWNAFRFSGSGSETKIENFTISGGDYVHSISLWLNSDEDYTDITTPDTRKIFFLGDDVTSGPAATSGVSALSFSAHDNSGEGYLRWYHWGNDTNYTIKLRKNEWYHVTLVYKGGTSDTQEVYVNNKRIEPLNSGSSSDPISLPTTIDLFLGRGRTASKNAFKGMIANFRLYSKTLNADQVKELYDYQKDYFLGSKSQVTLYKGHLGVGVTEPSGQLELAGDERIQEYPPGPMDGYETLIPGHGVFSAITSSYYSGNHGWKAFNKIIADGGDGWVSKYPEESYTRADGLPNSTASIFYDGVIGEWIQLEFPYSIKLKEAYLYEREPQGSTYAYNTSPRDVRILGKKKNGNNDEWVHLFSVSDLVYTQQQGNTPKILNVNSNEFYSSYVLQLTRIGGPDGTDAVGNGWADVAEWKLFGTPGPTTLDKGSLSLTRSLDVPRVSRYDVDTETPRPEKLVLDFDTTVNSSPTDISGKGNHGVFKGNAVYSAADKAFKFDGEDAGPADYIIGNLNNTGDTDFTVSLWLKKDRSGTYGTLWNFGGSGGSGNPEDSVAVQVTSGDRLDFFIFSGAKIEISNFGVDYLNKWVHIVATRTGIDLKIYLDGVDQNLSITGSAPTHTLQLAANTEYTIGARGTGSLGTNSLSGYISNFKVYDVVLEPSEVKKLYNLGRTGRSMVISDTAVGIGKVPEAQLDVRGNLGVSGHITNSGPRLEICDDSTGVHGYGTSGKGVKFSHAGIVFDRTWGNYPSLGVFTKNIDGNTNQAEFRIHGFDQSYISYPDSSGEADFSVVTRCDGGYQSGSDRRMKINITTIDEALKKVCLLTGKRYQLINRNGDINKNVSQNSYNYGLIAQDIEKAGIDEIYKHNEHEDDKTENYNSAYSINYDSIVPILINAIKELHAEIQTLEHKDHTRELRIENNSLKSKITRLERKTTDQELELIQLKRRLNKLERPT